MTTLTDALPENARPTTTRSEWNGLIVEARTEFGKAARRNRGNYAGTKIHRLRTEYVVGIVPGTPVHPGEAGARFQKTGKPVLLATYPACGCTMGYHAGMPVAGLTAEHVNCAKCLARG
jgi:hypothetical protein